MNGLKKIRKIEKHGKLQPSGRKVETISSTQPRVKALAYMRTSSSTNVGHDKDSERRQREAIASFAESAGYVIAESDWFYDAAVKGSDEIERRPGFKALLERVEDNGVRVLIIEDASRLARKLMVQELGILSLIKRGVQVLTSSGDDLSDAEDEMRVMVRQVMGSFAELERKRLVKKLKAAREHKKAEAKSLTLDGRGKCGGRLSLREKRPEVLEAARALNDGQSLDKIAAALAAQGHVTPSGKPYSATAIKTLLGDEFHSKAKEIRSYVKRKKAFYGSRESESAE